MVLDANGIRIRASRMPSVTPAPFTVLGWEVPDIAEVVTGLAAKGATPMHRAC